MKKSVKLNEMFLLRNLKVKIRRDKMRQKKATRSTEKYYLLQKCFHAVVVKPILFLCHLTIPQSESEKWRRSFAMLNPTCALLFFLATSDSK